MPAPTEVARATKIATTNSPLTSSQRRQTKVQYAEKEGAFKFISAKQEKDGEAYSSATASSGTSIPTGPVNGFWWDPAFDSFNTGATGGVDPAHFQGPQKTASGPVKIIRPFVLGSLVGSLGATIYQVWAGLNSISRRLTILGRYLCSSRCTQQYQARFWYCWCTFLDWRGRGSYLRRRSKGSIYERYSAFLVIPS
jgi:hypothetical protein